MWLLLQRIQAAPKNTMAANWPKVVKMVDYVKSHVDMATTIPMVMPEHLVELLFCLEHGTGPWCTSSSLCHDGHLGLHRSATTDTAA